MRVRSATSPSSAESLTNVTVDAARHVSRVAIGDSARGSEAIESNRAPALLCAKHRSRRRPARRCVQLVRHDRCAAVGALAQMIEYVDLPVPRAVGIDRALDARIARADAEASGRDCHVTSTAPPISTRRSRLPSNAKTQRTARTARGRLRRSRKVSLREYCPRWVASTSQRVWNCAAVLSSREILEAAGVTGVVDAVDEDWRTEYLAPILSISTCPASRMRSRISTRSVASTPTRSSPRITRTDAVPARSRFGIGPRQRFDSLRGWVRIRARAEIGISNDKLHARGPVGLEGLTSLKYVVFGDGEVRAADGECPGVFVDQSGTHHFCDQLVCRTVLPSAHLRQSGDSRRRGYTRAIVDDGAQAAAFMTGLAVLAFALGMWLFSYGVGRVRPG